MQAIVLKGAYLKFGGGSFSPPLPPLEKGGNQIGSPPFEGGFRGIELELEATPSTLKYTLLKGLQNKAFHGKRKNLMLEGWFQTRRSRLN